MKQNIKAILITGGNSKERGISLNSCRSVYDHLPKNVEKNILYFDSKLDTYLINNKLIYSNTPQDFEFKLKKEAKKIEKNELNSFFGEYDFAIPLIHGPFGEDGELQKILEEAKIPFIGSKSSESLNAFDKARAYDVLKENGFKVNPFLLLDFTNDFDSEIEKKVDDYLSKGFKEYVLKPCLGGSSIDVYRVSKKEEIINCTNNLKKNSLYDRFILEPFINGREFTIIVLENDKGEPVSLIPSEIEIKQNTIFDYRKKYLATNETRYNHPPNVSEKCLEEISKDAENIFKIFELSDYVRIDGWILDNEEVLFTDINCASGMEQNSFFFLQSALLGFSHKGIIKYVVDNFLKKNKINFELPTLNVEAKEKIAVIFGGETAEKNVSIMSGTNVWLKLQDTEKFNPKPYFLDDELNVWKIPYLFALFHTANEIKELCNQGDLLEKKVSKYREKIIKQLNPSNKIELSSKLTASKYSVMDFLRKEKLLFIALHGEFGEGGKLQELCEKEDVAYTCSRPETLKLCMNKYETGEFIKKLNEPDITTALRVSMKSKECFSCNVNELWKKLSNVRLKNNSLIVKPLGDGCSAGVVRLSSEADLENYLLALKNEVEFIERNVISNEDRQIEMPASCPESLIFEGFIETDELVVKDRDIIINDRTGIVEITVGVYGDESHLKALNPSITVSSSSILTLEEKFQGGTGVNLTPPPEHIISKEVNEKIRKNILLLATKVKIRGLSRIDAFVERKTGKLTIIEINAIPGLSPSTVTYHQALKENPPLYPSEFLKKIVEVAKNRKNVLLSASL